MGIYHQWCHFFRRTIIELAMTCTSASVYQSTFTMTQLYQMRRRGGGINNLDVTLFHGPTTEIRCLSGAQLWCHLRYIKAGRGALCWREAKTRYIYIHIRGSCWIHWESPSLNPTCTLRCFPKVKPYINYVGVSKTKQKHDLPLGHYSGSWSAGERVVGGYIPQYWRNLLGYPSDVLRM